MKFGIFVFGDNHPELGRSNQKYYEEVLTMGEWAEELGFDSRAMKFGIFIFGDNHPELGRSNQKYYEEVLTIGEWAEELGFDSFWLGEHHLYWYGTCVSPPMLIAALGQRTKRIRLGPAVSVLPLHHPLLVAEEYALADNLCGGRLNFAIGSGFSPVEYKTFGMTMEEAREKYWEVFDVILKAWTQEKFSHQGKYYQIEDGSLYMKPLQKPLPPTWIAASSDDTLIRAGEMGFPDHGNSIRAVHLAARGQTKERTVYGFVHSCRPQGKAGHYGRPACLPPP